MKKLACLALAVLMLALSGCGGKSGGIGRVLSGVTGSRGRELRMNVTMPETSVWMVAANTFKEQVETRTNGRYTVTIFPNEQLSGGDVTKGVENLFNGEVELDLHSIADMQSCEERLAVVSMPWLFPNGYSSVDEILFNGPGKEALFNLIRNRGAEPLALGENGFWQITNNRGPVSVSADLDGLRVRVPDNTMLEEFFRLLGADPVVVNWPAALDVLVDGYLDGQANALDAIQSSEIHKVQRYLTLWYCVYDPLCLSVSNAVWDSLSESDRGIFRTAAEEACRAEIAASRALDGPSIGEISDSGVEVTALTGAEFLEFQSRTAALYDTWRGRIGDPLFAAFGYAFP